MRWDLLARAAVLAALASVAAAVAFAQAPAVADGQDRQFKINGRVQYDYFNISQDFANPATADADHEGGFARRAFLGVEGRLTQRWRYNVKLDFAPIVSSGSGRSEEVRWDDAYLEYDGDGFSVFVGQHNAVVHMEDRISSAHTPFNERAMIDQALDFGKTFGVAVLANGRAWFAGAAFHTDSIDSGQAFNTNGQHFFTVRGILAPIYLRTQDGVRVLHLGVNARHREGGAGVLSYSARPAQNSGSGLGSTISSAGDFGSDNLLGAEIAAQWNAFGASAEFMQIDAAGAGVGADGEASGGYFDLFWSPTGESRNYQAADGSWGRVTPRVALGGGGVGHVMLSARYEFLDLSDASFGAGVAGRGEQTGYNFGATWQPIAHVKVQLNYGMYELDRPATANDQDIDSITLRTQFDW